jgi:hypothetical protein
LGVAETEHFANEGFGWECKRCREAAGGDATAPGGEGPAASLARFFREGEAEAGGPRLSSRSLARWTDGERTTLRCPACGVEEDVRG